LGTNFIIRHVIGLNGMMTGTGSRSPGNPMRAVLRSLGRGNDPKERAERDRLVPVLIRAFRKHGPVRPVR
jgi:hypothetical protein